MTSGVYRVVSILDEKSVVINYGIQDGAKDGDKLVVFTEGREIKDPETGEALGTLDYIKANIEVVAPYEKMSKCQAVTKYEPGLADLASRSIITQGKSYRPDLNVDEKEMIGESVPTEKVIKTGDTVRRL